LEDEHLKEIASVQLSLALARKTRPAYEELYAILEALLVLQIDAKHALRVALPKIAADQAATRWEEGFPLLRRWDFPVDAEQAEAVLVGMQKHIPDENLQLKSAHYALMKSLSAHEGRKAEIFRTFLQHDGETWEEWIETEGVDLASLLIWGRAAVRPSIEWTAEKLTEQFPVPKTWLKGYCPVCGSLPSLLFLLGEGQRGAYCSWCATKWDIHRLQCPYCDNRHQESLGYLAIEQEPFHRIEYCEVCKRYFKLLDLREKMEPVLPALEEWTTLHLDMLAHQAGWQQAPSPSPVVYGDSEATIVSRD
jgi:FdhE protein